jgi:hypothetical protein
MGAPDEGHTEGMGSGLLFVMRADEVDRCEADGPEEMATIGWCCGCVGSSAGIS